MAHWQDSPFIIDVKKGDTKAICRCGKTSNPPFCDGSHRGSEFTPNVITFEEDKKVAICGCGKTGNPPFCDGTHRK